MCWRRDRLPTLVLWGFSGGSAGKESTAMREPQETWVWFLGGEDLEEGMAIFNWRKIALQCCVGFCHTSTHSSIGAWRIPWVDEPGRLQSKGWPRVRHPWSNWARTNPWCSRAVVPSIFGTRDQFCGRQFFHRPWGWFRDDSNALHLLCTLFLLLLYQVHLRSSSIRSRRLGIPTLHHSWQALSAQCVLPLTVLHSTIPGSL